MLIYLIFTTEIITLSSLIAYYLRIRGTRHILISPLLYFSVFFAIIHIALPLLQYYFEFYRYQTYNEYTIYYSIIISFCAYVVFFITFTISEGSKRINFKLPSPSPESKYKFLSFSIFFFLVGSYYCYKNINEIINIGIDNYITDRISLGLGGGLGILLGHWIYISCILFFVGFKWYTTSKKIRSTFMLMFLISLTFSISYYSINSNRNSIFILLTNIIVLSIFTEAGSTNTPTSIKPKRLFKLFAVSIAAFLLLSSLGSLRKSQYSYDELSPLALASDIVSSLNGAFGNHENVAWLLQNDYDLQLGGTYIAGFLNLIPRKLWPNKPLGAGPILKNMIQPNSYIIGERGNSSLTTGLLTEAQMNFGVFGMLVFVSLYGLILSFIEKLLYTNKNSSFNILIFFSLVSLSTLFLYSEFLGFFARFVISSIPLLVIGATMRKDFS